MKIKFPAKYRMDGKITIPALQRRALRLKPKQVIQVTIEVEDPKDVDA